MIRVNGVLLNTIYELMGIGFFRGKLGRVVLKQEWDMKCGCRGSDEFLFCGVGMVCENREL